MRGKLIATAVAIAVTGSSTAAYAVHTSAQHGAGCASVKLTNSTNFTLVNQTHKTWVQAQARYGQTDPRVTAAALTKDQTEGAEMRYIAAHGSCFPAADVNNAEKWVGLDAAAVVRDRQDTAN